LVGVVVIVGGPVWLDVDGPTLVIDPVLVGGGGSAGVATVWSVFGVDLFGPDSGAALAALAAVREAELAGLTSAVFSEPLVLGGGVSPGEVVAERVAGLELLSSPVRVAPVGGVSGEVEGLSLGLLGVVLAGAVLVSGVGIWLMGRFRARSVGSVLVGEVDGVW
jgi:hypothetical protein